MFVTKRKEVNYVNHVYQRMELVFLVIWAFEKKKKKKKPLIT